MQDSPNIYRPTVPLSRLTLAMLTDKAPSESLQHKKPSSDRRLALYTRWCTHYFLHESKPGLDFFADGIFANITLTWS